MNPPSNRADSASPLAEGHSVVSPKPFTGLAGLSPSDAMDGARLMGVILALAGEVYVLKAEVQRLRVALELRELIDDKALDEAARSPEMERWQAREEREFAPALLRAFTEPDEAPDVSAAMNAR